MGCVFSSFDDDEKVRTCKDRKRLIKQLVKIRGEFSDSLLAYLKALRNTGGTLRQFTESDLLEQETTSNGLAEPPSPQPDLLPPPPPPYSPAHPRCETVESVEEEHWQETITEFEDDIPEAEAVVVSGKQQSIELVDDNSSAMSLCTKDTSDMPMVVVRNQKTLEGITKELDDYFLKASAGVKEINVLFDIKGGDTLLPQNSVPHNRKRSNSAKVFNVLSWSRYSKPAHFTKDAAEFSAGPGEPCRPGAHCATLKKLYAAEKKLFKVVKEEGIAKLEFERKSLLLQKQEDENLEWTKIEKTRSSVENLESYILHLQQSISETTSLILELINEELLPQLVALTSGLTRIWRTMQECHHAQTLISQQLSHLNDDQNAILNSEYHHQATIQFEAEASYWYSSFCKLVKSQREYVRTLFKWIKLTNCLQDGHECSDGSSRIGTICEQWEHGLDQLTDKVASDAIKALLSSIHSIIAQQAEEDNILKRLEKLERRLQRGLNSLAEMKEKIKYSFDHGDIPVNMSPTHPLSLKQTKIEALKKQVESERAKYSSSVQHSRAMTLSNLKTRLPHVFQSLMEFSGASAQAIDEAIHSQVKPVECSDVASQN